MSDQKLLPALGQSSICLISLFLFLLHGLPHLVHVWSATNTIIWTTDGEPNILYLEYSFGDCDVNWDWIKSSLHNINYTEL